MRTETRGKIQTVDCRLLSESRHHVYHWELTIHRLTGGSLTANLSDIQAITGVQAFTAVSLNDQFTLLYIYLKWPQSAVCILPLVCVLPPVFSL